MTAGPANVPMRRHGLKVMGLFLIGSPHVVEVQC